MAHIDYQKVKYDENGIITSGSASIRDTVYDNSVKGRCTHPLIENLGKVIWISEDRKSGIFQSPTRGLVEYDVLKNVFTDVKKDDARIKSSDLFQEPLVHTVIGDSYLILKVCEKKGLIGLLRKVFLQNKDYERVLCHLVHNVARNGSKISCDDYTAKSFMSYLLKNIPVSSLGSDTVYFSMMGRDDIKLKFFKEFVKMMRKKYPSFGSCCYIDSTPLPNDISDNPFNALCSHGIGSVGIQTRLVLVLDEETGLPVWFQTIPGNVLDLSTINSVRDNLKEQLDIDIYHMVLDAGYVTKNLITQYHLDSEPVLDDKAEEHYRFFIGKMPARTGFPFKTLYHQTCKMFSNAKYEFIRGDHSYFGFRKEIVIFEKREYAYIYVDKDNALQLGRKWRQENEELYDKMTDKDKNWYSVKAGYFVLLSNEEKTPAAMLDEYFGRTRIETVFKTAKEYLQLLPLSKWTLETVSGKLLSDCISTIVYLMIQKDLDGSKIAMTRLLGQTSSLMCMKTRDGVIRADTANKQTRAAYKALKISVPTNFKLADYCETSLLMNLGTA